MASVYKFPIAVAVLDAAESGRIGLDSLVRVQASDLRPGASPLAARYPGGGVDVRVADLLAGMLVDSDNTASDVLLRLAGGPSEVTACMRILGCEDLRVDRYEVEIFFDASGVMPGPRYSDAAAA
jgi:beta-lactamase class A